MGQALFRYVRFAPKFWADEKVRQWSDLVKLLAIHLLSSAHRTLEGYFVCPIAYLATDLGWSLKEVSSRLDVLIRDGFVSVDTKAHLILIRNATKYQWPESTNVVTGVIRRVRALPQSPLLDEFLNLVQQHCGQSQCLASARTFALALERAFGPPSQRPSELLNLESGISIENQESQSLTESRRNGAKREHPSSLSQSDEEVGRKEIELRQKFPHLAEVG